MRRYNLLLLFQQLVQRFKLQTMAVKIGAQGDDDHRLPGCIGLYGRYQVVHERPLLGLVAAKGEQFLKLIDEKE